MRAWEKIMQMLNTDPIKEQYLTWRYNYFKLLYLKRIVFHQRYVLLINQGVFGLEWENMFMLPVATTNTEYF